MRRARRRASAARGTLPCASTPSCDVTRLRFVSPDTVASSVDDLGETALSGVLKFIAEFEDAGLAALWEEVRREK